MALGKIYINPEILWRPSGKEYYDEGCFSIPGKLFRVWRPYAIRVRYQGPDQKFYEEKLTGVKAEVFQHEYNHLEGICIADEGIEIDPSTGNPFKTDAKT
jgi:peptide deformylase